MTTRDRRRLTEGCAGLQRLSVATCVLHAVAILNRVHLGFNRIPEDAKLGIGGWLDYHYGLPGRDRAETKSLKWGITNRVGVCELGLVGVRQRDVDSISAGLAAYRRQVVAGDLRGEMSDHGSSEVAVRRNEPTLKCGTIHRRSEAPALQRREGFASGSVPEFRHR